MNTATKKKLTIMLDSQVYEGIKNKVGSRGIGAYLSLLARPHVLTDTLQEGYKAMALDKKYNEEAFEWIEGTLDSVE
jgi:hypothetical protein